MPFSDIWPVQVVWGLMHFSFKEVPLKEKSFSTYGLITCMKFQTSILLVLLFVDDAGDLTQDLTTSRPVLYHGLLILGFLFRFGGSLLIL